jgi:hypothetical protein
LKPYLARSISRGTARTRARKSRGHQPFSAHSYHNFASPRSDWAATTPLPVTTQGKSSWTNQYYGQYSRGKLTVDSEYRRYWDSFVVDDLFPSTEDMRGWYVAGSYQLLKRLQLGSYYSRYQISYFMAGYGLPPAYGHDYDKMVTVRIDLNRVVNIKMEGHFMDGYGLPEDYPNGFYLGDNLTGLKPNTTALVVKTGFSF